MKTEGRGTDWKQDSQGQQDIRGWPLPGPFGFASFLTSSTPSDSSHSPSPTQTIPWLRWGRRQHTKIREDWAKQEGTP